MATRVLHILHSMNCGGAENLIMNIYRNIDRDKVQFDFLVNVFDKMFFEDEITSLGGKIYRMPFLTKVTPIVYEKNLYKFFKENEHYQIVHSHLETTTGIILRQASKAGVQMKIAHSHNSRFTRTGFGAAVENLYKSYCRKQIVKNADVLLSCSSLASAWLYQGHAHKAVVLNNAIDAELYRFSEKSRTEIREQMKVTDDTRVLGHVGRFNDQKNHLFLLDIFKEYVKKNSETELWLVGEGVLEGQIRQRARELKIDDKIRFLGLRDDVNKLMSAMDLFLLPSKFEGLPVTLIEAQAAGLNCILADNIAPEVDLDCVKMEFLDIDSAEPWARAIEKIPSSHTDTLDNVKEKGFDTKSSAEFLMSLYLSRGAQSAPDGEGL